MSNPAELLKQLNILGFICRKSSPSHSGAQVVTLRSYLSSLVTSSARLASLRADADHLRDCIRAQAKRKAARVEEEREGLVLIKQEEEAIGLAEADIKLMEKEVAQGSQEMATIELEIESLKLKIEKSYDPSKAALVEKEIQMSKKRLLEVEVNFSTAKKNLDNLEGQLSKKKALYKSKCNLESTIKKHNDDLEEKVRTTRKEIDALSSSKKPIANEPSQYGPQISFNTDEKPGPDNHFTPTKGKNDGPTDCLRKNYQTPGSINRFNSFKTPTKTSLRYQESPGFSPTYELAEIEHGCKLFL